MDSRLVNRLLAKLTIAFSSVLLVPLIAALFADREHIWIFIFTLITTSTIASLFNLFGSRRPRQRLRVREAIAVVGCRLAAGLSDGSTAVFVFKSGGSDCGGF